MIKQEVKWFKLVTQFVTDGLHAPVCFQTWACGITRLSLKNFQTFLLTSSTVFLQMFEVLACRKFSLPVILWDWGKQPLVRELCARRVSFVYALGTISLDSSGMLTPLALLTKFSIHFNTSQIFAVCMSHTKLEEVTPLGGIRESILQCHQSSR